MEKRFGKSKIIILSIAILTAIVSLFIGIYGIVNKRKQSNYINRTANAWGSLDGFKSGMKTQTINGTSYDINYTTSYISFWYGNSCILEADIDCSTETYTGNSDKETPYNGTYIVKDSFKIESFTVHTNNGYILYKYLKSNGLKIDYLHIDKDSIGNDDFSSKSFTYGCGSVSVSLSGSANVVYGGYTFEAHYHWSVGASYWYNNKEILNFYYSNVSISDEIGLMLFAYLVNEGTAELTGVGARYYSVTLQDNLNMSGISMPPIGTSSIPYAQTFNGNGYTISNLPLTKTTASKSSYYGLFGYISGAKISNLYIYNAQWSDAENSSRGLYAGILVGRASGTCIINSCLLRSCTIDIKDTSAYSFGSLGAVIGKVDDNSSVTINNCGVVVDIKGTNINNIGGHIGNVGSNSSANINYSYYKGSVYGRAPARIEISGELDMFYGGLCGGKSSKLNAMNCYVGVTSVDLNNGYSYEVDSEYYWETSGEYGYYEYSAILGTNNNNKIYVNSCSLKYYYGGGLGCRDGIQDGLTDQVQNLNGSLF